MSSFAASDFATVATALGFGALLAAIVNGIFNKRRMSADATKLITEAAASVVKTVRDEMDQRQRIFDQTIALMEQRASDRDQRLAQRIEEHAAWDRMVISAAEKAGLVLPPAPRISFDGV